MKAMLLAAGRGERLKPLTDVLPKPLIPVGEKTLIENNLEKIREAGITEVVINISYRAKQIMDHVGTGQRFGLHVTYSYEPNQPLGTGGGIHRALHLLGDEPFLLLSSDIWTDFSFEIVNARPKGDAHLIFVDNPDFHPEGDFCLLPSGEVSADTTPKLTYANIAVLHPRLFKKCKTGVFSLAPLLSDAMLTSSVTGEYFQGQWYNIGTPKELAKLKKLLA